MQQSLSVGKRASELASQLTQHGLLSRLGRRPKDALTIYSKMKEHRIDTGGESIHYLLAESHRLMGAVDEEHYNKAIEYYLKELEIIQNKPNSGEKQSACWLAIRKCYWDRGDRESTKCVEAQNGLDKLIGQEPNTYEPLLAVANWLVEQQIFDLACHTLECSIQKVSYSELRVKALVLRSDAERACGNFEEAISANQEAIELCSDKSWVSGTQTEQARITEVRLLLHTATDKAKVLDRVQLILNQLLRGEDIEAGTMEAKGLGWLKAENSQVIVAALICQANVHLCRGQVDEALTIFKNMSKECEPYGIQSKTLLSLPEKCPPIYFTDHTLQHVILFYTELLIRHGAVAQVYWYRACVHRLLGDMNRFMDDLETMHYLQKDFLLSYMKAVSHSDQHGDWHMCEPFVWVQPLVIESVGSLIMRAQCVPHTLFQKIDSILDCARAYYDSLPVMRDDITFTSRRHACKGDMARICSSIKPAIELFDQSIAITPLDGLGMVGKILTYVEAYQLDDAIKTCVVSLERLSMEILRLMPPTGTPAQEKLGIVPREVEKMIRRCEAVVHAMAPHLAEQQPNELQLLRNNKLFNQWQLRRAVASVLASASVAYQAQGQTESALLLCKLARDVEPDCPLAVMQSISLQFRYGSIAKLAPDLAAYPDRIPLFVVGVPMTKQALYMLPATAADNQSTLWQALLYYDGSNGSQPSSLHPCITPPVLARELGVANPCNFKLALYGKFATPPEAEGWDAGQWFDHGLEAMKERDTAQFVSALKNCANQNSLFCADLNKDLMHFHDAEPNPTMSKHAPSGLDMVYIAPAKSEQVLMDLIDRGKWYEMNGITDCAIADFAFCVQIHPDAEAHWCLHTMSKAIDNKDKSQSHSLEALIATKRDIELVQVATTGGVKPPILIPFDMNQLKHRQQAFSMVIANHYYNEGDWQECLNYCTEAIEIKQGNRAGNALCHRLRSLAYSQQDKHSKAIEDLEVYCKVMTKDFGSLLRCANLYSHVGRNEKASLAFQDLQTLTGGGHPQVLYSYALYNYREEKFTNAKSLLTKCLEGKPDHIAAKALLGAVLERLGELQGALKTCMEVRETDPQFDNIERMIGRIRLGMAQNMFSSLVKQEYAMIARMIRKQQAKLNEAQRKRRLAVKTDMYDDDDDDNEPARVTHKVDAMALEAPSSPSLNYVMLNLHHAYKALKDAARNKSDDNDTNFMLAVCTLFNAGPLSSHDETVLSYVEKILVTAKEHEGALFLKGIMQHRQGQVDEALNSYENYLALAPGHEFMNRARAYVFAIRPSKTQAFEVLDQLIAKGGKMKSAGFANRGLLEMMKGSLKKAMEDLDKALLEDPHNPLARLYRAECNRRLGDYPDAVRDYQRGLPMLSADFKSVEANIQSTGVPIEYGKVFEKSFTCPTSIHHYILPVLRQANGEDHILGTYGMGKFDIASIHNSLGVMLHTAHMRKLNGLGFQAVGKQRNGNVHGLSWVERERRQQLGATGKIHEIEKPPEALKDAFGRPVNIISDEAVRCFTEASNSYHAHYNKGVVFLGQLDLPKALDSFGSCVEANKEFHDGRNNYGVVLERCGRVAEASEEYFAAMGNKVQSVSAFNLANTKAAAQRYREAIDLYTTFIDAHIEYGRTVQATYDRGSYAHAHEHEKGSMDYLAEIEAMKRKVWDDSAHLLPAALNNRSICYYSVSEYQRALEGYNMALDRNPKLVFAKFNRVHAYIALGDCHAALQDIRDVQRARGSKYLTNLYEFCKRYQWGLAVACKDLLSGIIALPVVNELNLSEPVNPQNLFDPYKLGENESSDFIRLDEALSLLAGSIHTCDDPHTARKFVTLMESAVTYQRQSNIEKTRVCLIEATYLIPVLPSKLEICFSLKEMIFLWRARILVKDGKTREAINDLQLAVQVHLRAKPNNKKLAEVVDRDSELELDPEEEASKRSSKKCLDRVDSTLLNYMGYLLHFGKEHDQAFEMWDKAVKVDDTNLYALLNRGNMARAQGRFRAATLDYGKVVEVLQSSEYFDKLTGSQFTVCKVIRDYLQVLEQPPYETWDTIGTLQGSLAMAIDQTEMEAEDAGDTDKYEEGEHPRELLDASVSEFIDHLVKAKEAKDTVLNPAQANNGLQQAANKDKQMLSGRGKRLSVTATNLPKQVQTTRTHEDGFASAFKEMQSLIGQQVTQTGPNFRRRPVVMATNTDSFNEEHERNQTPEGPRPPSMPRRGAVAAAFKKSQGKRLF